MILYIRNAVFLALLLVFSFPVWSQGSSAPCSAPEYAQFDFWVGKWNVVDRKSRQPAGKNTIQKTLGGCILFESWNGGGTMGHSFNTFDVKRGVWHQTWVDNQGTVLQLDGSLKDGAMVLEGKGLAKNGKTELLHRITWTPQEDTVRQHWEVSKNGGKTWRNVFDGIYSRISD